MDSLGTNNDGSLINIIKSYHDYENEKKKTFNNSNKKTNTDNYSIEEKESFLEQSQDSVLFSNFFIQNSLTRFNILKKIIFKKQNTILIHYISKWQAYLNNRNIKNKFNDLQSSVEIDDYNPYSFNERQKSDSKDYLQKNREIIETYCEESITSYSDYDYLNLNTSSKYDKFESKIDKKIGSTNNKNNESNDYDYPLQSLKETKNINGNKRSLCLTLKNIILNKLKNEISFFYGKLQLYINSKKLANSSLSLLYIFTELAISKNKLKSSKKHLINVDQENSFSNNSQSKHSEISQLKQKLEEYEKKITKYETNLNEKAMIIESRNDRIEGLLETNEALQEEIKKLSNKVDRLERKTKNLNIVEESICKNCANSLEESFISHAKDSPRKDNHMINELKKIIQEQLDYIVKMENDSKELRIKNEEYRRRNEMIKEELDIIKEEFRLFSDGLNNKKFLNQQNLVTDQDLNNTVSILKINLTDAFTQTGIDKCEIENSSNNKNQILTKNKKTPTSSSISSTSLKKSTKKFSTKLTLNKEKDTQSSASNNITNYNIININNSNSSNNFSTPSGKISNIGNNSNISLSSINDTEREVVQSLRFDNSLLTQEILNLNKELTKSKNEMKICHDNFKKLEKEKNESVTKLKSKTENFDKIKKENEELMILINTSNYKSFISVENENKKLKFENQGLSKELEYLKTEFNTKEKKLNEIEIEFNNTKKLCENLNKFKTEREDLVLENAKLESELKQNNYEVESSKNLIERQNILLKRQDETINKLNEEINYINFNAKKIKSEADRAREDSVTYQQIVRKLEKELSDAVTKKDKIENELNIIKQQLGQFGNFSFKNNK